MRKRSDHINEQLWMRALLITLAVGFLCVLVGLPLASVFAEAFRKGTEAYMNSLKEENAVAAIKLTLLVASIGGKLGDCKI